MLRNVFKMNVLSEKEMLNLKLKHFMGTKSLMSSQITTYMQFLTILNKSYSRYQRNLKVLTDVVKVIDVYAEYMCLIINDTDSDVFDISIRHLKQVTKELYDFVIVHKNIMQLKDIYTVLSTKNTFKIAKTSINYTNE